VARKKEAHHGGAWKVAYADFVTAMMALFMVLWICAQDKKILIATSQYFQSPFKSALTANAGVMPYQSAKSGSDDGESGSNKANSLQQIEIAFLNSLAKDLLRVLHLEQDIANKPIDIQVTSDGLRLTLFDRPDKPIFRENSAEFTEWGEFLMQNLAWMIDRQKFRVMIAGHTRSGIKFLNPDYGSWELSIDRANASRRILTHYAVLPELIDRISGFADTDPLPGAAPDNDSNQRVSISLTLGKHARNSDRQPPAQPPSVKAAAAQAPMEKQSRAEPVATRPKPTSASRLP